MARAGLFQLGMHSGFPSTAQTEDTHFAADSGAEERLDYFVEHDGVRCASVHLIVDLVGAKRLDDIAHIETTLKRCVDASGATLLHIKLHHFTPNGGVSGGAVLAENHISIPTWPERDFTALDIFMCGQAEPEAAIPVLENALEPDTTRVKSMLRGRDS